MTLIKIAKKNKHKRMISLHHITYARLSLISFPFSAVINLLKKFFGSTEKPKVSNMEKGKRSKKHPTGMIRNPIFPALELDVFQRKKY